MWVVGPVSVPPFRLRGCRKGTTLERYRGGGLHSWVPGRQGWWDLRVRKVESPVKKVLQETERVRNDLRRVGSPTSNSRDSLT